MGKKKKSDFTFASKDTYLSSSSVLHCDQGTITTEEKKLQALLSVIYLMDTSHKKTDIWTAVSLSFVYQLTFSQKPKFYGKALKAILQKVIIATTANIS